MCIFLSLISSIDPSKTIFLVQNGILCYSSWMTLPLEQMKCTHRGTNIQKIVTFVDLHQVHSCLCSAPRIPLKDEK